MTLGMSRIVWLVCCLVVSLAAAPLTLWAAEHGGQEHKGAATAPANPAAGGTQEHGGTAATPSAPAGGQEHGGTAAAPAVTPAPTTPALKPILITFTGNLSALDQASTPALITVEDRYGVKKEITCPGDCKIGQGGVSKTLADLKTGDKLTVEYTYDVATGKRTAQAI